MMKHFCILILLCASVNMINAQSFFDEDSTSKPKKFMFNGIYLGGGLFVTPSVHMNQNKLDASWKGFSKQYYYNYMESDYSSSGYTGNSCYEIGASFYTNWGKTDSLFNRWQMHIGLVYLLEQSTISSFENYTATRIDTLAPTSGAANYYMDHVEYNSVYVTHSTDLLGLNISEMYIPHHDKFVSFTGGFGLQALLGVNSKIYESAGTWTVNYVTDNTFFDYNKERPNVQFNSPVSSYTKTYNSTANYSLMDAYVAGGCQFRWITGKGGTRIILNPLIRAGVKTFNVSKGGSYYGTFGLFTVNLKVVFK